MQFDDGKGSGPIDDGENAGDGTAGDGGLEQGLPDNVSSGTGNAGKNNAGSPGDSEDGAIVNKYDFPVQPLSPNNSSAPNGSKASASAPAQSPPQISSQQASKGIIESILEWLSGLFGG